MLFDCDNTQCSPLYEEHTRTHTRAYTQHVRTSTDSNPAQIDTFGASLLAFTQIEKGAPLTLSYGKALWISCCLPGQHFSPHPLCLCWYLCAWESTEYICPIIKAQFHCGKNGSAHNDQLLCVRGLGRLAAAAVAAIIQILIVCAVCAKSDE